MATLHPATLAFLDAIREENTRAYFATVKPLYQEILTSVSDLCQAIIDETGIQHEDHRALTPRDCLFRIYRDARRLKEGDYIYKHNFWLAIAPLGKKDSRWCYYVHIEPWNSHFSAGMYRPKGPTLRNLRQRIADEWLAYITHISHPDFVDRFGTVYGQKLTGMPRGFNHYDHHVELLKMKQHLITRPYTDEEVLSDTFLDNLLTDIHLAQPRFDRIRWKE